MSGHRAVAEVDVIATTRRRWSAAERRTILAEADADGAVVSEVARRHGVWASLLFRWRRLRKEAKSTGRSEPAFVSLALPAPAPAPNETTSAPVRHGGRIEIVLSGGHRIIVGKDEDTAALRRIVNVLERR